LAVRRGLEGGWTGASLWVEGRSAPASAKLTGSINVDGHVSPGETCPSDDVTRDVMLRGSRSRTPPRPTGTAPVHPPSRPRRTAKPVAGLVPARRSSAWHPPP